MSVCLWPLLKLLDLAVLVVLWWCKTRRGAILAVLVDLWTQTNRGAILASGE